jgi:hypothetical protein
MHQMLLETAKGANNVYIRDPFFFLLLGEGNLKRPTSTRSQVDPSFIHLLMGLGVHPKEKVRSC